MEEQAAPARSIPRTIWIMWWQGWDQAPEISHARVRSWRHHNPDWRLVLLDKDNLAQHLDTTGLPTLTRPDIAIQKRANIIRLGLLEQHGGVWADATTFCAKPLDDWLPVAAASGFFAFAKPRSERELSNWFLAASQNSELIARLSQAHFRYWQHNSFERQGNLLGRAALLLQYPLGEWIPRLGSFWFSRFADKALRVYPYFIFHYHFELLLRTDPEFRRLWEAVPRYSARVCHRVQSVGMYGPPSVELKAFIDQAETPVHKLNWKLQPDRPGNDNALNYLFDTLTRDPLQRSGDQHAPLEVGEHQQ